MSTPLNVPDDYEQASSTVLVPRVLWDQIADVVNHEGPDPLRREAQRLTEEADTYQTLEEGSLPYQIMDVLAKSDGNLTTHMTSRTLMVMYGEMVRNLTRTFDITRKEDPSG